MRTNTFPTTWNSKNLGCSWGVSMFGEAASYPIVVMAPTTTTNFFFFFRCLLWLITGLVFIGEDSWTLTDIVASLNNPWETLDWFLLKAIGSFYFSRFYKEPYTTVPEITAKCIITTAIFWQYIDLIPWIAAITWCFFFFIFPNSSL